MRLLINGRFLTRNLTGIDRVATEIVRALGVLSQGARPDVSMSLAVPANFRDEQLRSLEEVKFTSIVNGRLHGQAWEQLELPLLQRDATLLSLCNVGPWLRRNQLLIIHDAQVFLEPQSYAPAFRNWYRFIQPALGRRVRVVATDSCYSLEQLERFFVTPKGKASVIDLGVDHFRAVAADVETLGRYGLKDKEYLLAIGSLAPHKNLPMLIRAAAERPAGARELVIAGGGNAAVFRDAGIEPPVGVRLIGRVTDPELKALYTHARLFAFPSLTEGFGLPPLEAMACGCPVIASSAGAMPETCGTAAILLDPSDEAAWTRSLIELEADVDQQTRMSKMGTEHIKRFTWAAAATSLLRLLE